MRLEAPASPPPLAALYAEAIRRLGRHARPGGEVLDPATAGALWSALLARQFSSAQEAALLMGLRLHGESGAMLAAFAGATAAVLASRVVAPAGAAATVVLHAAGSARRQVMATPLLAQSLAQRGVPALIVAAGARPGQTGAVLRAQGEPPAADAGAAGAQLAARGWAWIELATLASGLARLMSLRAELGFRSSAHSVLKLLAPVLGRTLLIAAYTHAPYRAALADAIALRQASALLVRGTEGEPVAWESEAHPPLAWIAGARREFETAAAAPREAAALIAGDDTATAAWTQRVLAGTAAMPGGLAEQIRQIETLAREVPE